MPDPLSLIVGSILGVGSYKIGRILYRMYPYLWDSAYFKKLVPGESIVLVSGATDGIGKAYVENLLKQGFNVIAIGRN